MGSILAATVLAAIVLALKVAGVFRDDALKKCAEQAAAPLVRVYTHNVRYAAAAPSEGEEAWPARAPRSIAEAAYHTRGVPAALVCLQEVLHGQLLDFVAGLNGGAHGASDGSGEPGWAYVGVGRDDGKQAGEYAPIFYRPAVYRLDGSETVWLSLTPSVPSKGWGAGSVRILTVARLTHRASGKTVLALNTHLDDRSALARQEGAKIILRTIAACRAAHAVDAVVLAGDLNSEPHQEAYQTLTSASSPLVDAHARVPPAQRYGNALTFTGFAPHDTPSRIDYVLAGPRSAHAPSTSAPHLQDPEKAHADPPAPHGTAGPWSVHGYAVLPNRFDDRVFNSDHRAVVVDLAL